MQLYTMQNGMRLAGGAAVSDAQLVALLQSAQEKKRGPTVTVGTHPAGRSNNIVGNTSYSLRCR